MPYDPSLDDESLAQSPLELQMIAARKRLAGVPKRIYGGVPRDLSGTGELPDVSNLPPQLRGPIEERARLYGQNLNGIRRNSLVNAKAPNGGAYNPTPDQAGSVESAVAGSLVGRMAQPGEFANASPETRRHMIEARMRMMAGQPQQSFASVPSEDTKADRARKARMNQMADVGGKKYEAGSVEALDASAARQALARQQQKRQAADNLEAIKRDTGTQGGSFETARKAYTQQTKESNREARFQQRLRAQALKDLANNAAALQAMQIQHQPSAHDQLLNAQRRLIEAQLGGGSAAQPQAPPQPPAAPAAPPIGHRPAGALPGMFPGGGINVPDWMRWLWANRGANMPGGV